MARLDTYRAKRNFKATPEPAPRRGKRADRHEALQFVIQKHHASHLHYDFRLELEGTLKSWAVPKGPSLDPADRRLAVHVEDHPLEYGEFEGTIPKGNYGAGEVVLWDRGTWRPEGDARAAYREGKLKFELLGEKLHGRWTLVRTRLQGSGGKEQWLLIKEKDEVARPRGEYDITEAQPDSVKGKGVTRARASSTRTQAVAPGSLSGAKKAALPAVLAPQLATLLDKPPPQGQWVYEAKFDGYRMLARIEKGRVRLLTRNGLDWTAKLPNQRKALEQLGLASAWLDGEIVVPGANQAPDFQALQNAFDSAHTDRIVYYLFDVMFCGGYDLRRSPLHQRRALLRTLWSGWSQSSGSAPAKSPLIRFSEDFDAPAAQMLASACEMGLEGVIGKRRDSAYFSGRSRDWIKLKCTLRQEFVIGGFTDPQNSRAGLGALLLGVHEDGKLRYAGRVGTGFDDRLLRDLRRRLDGLEIDQPAYDELPRDAGGRGVHWVKPTLVAEVAFAQWTQEGLVRQAVFHGLRSDKPAKVIVREKPASARTLGNAAATAGPTRRAVKASKSSPRKGEAEKPVVAGLAISHAARVVDPSSGMTKLDVARYYESVAALILPHLKARPVSLVRAPEGLEGEQFFQKHADRLTIPGVRVLPRTLDPKHPPLMAIESVAALAGAAQMGTLELHTWNAVATAIERPDRVIFDLDPDPALPWARVVEAAELTKTLLDELGLVSFLKTSGGRGLHVVVPLMRRHTWEVARGFTQQFALHMAATLPTRFSATMGAKNRVGKVFVDYLRNTRGSSTVAAWSARARPGLPVSVPVAWEELVELKSSADWTIANVQQRIRDAADPWKDYEASRQALGAAIKKLKRI